MKPDENEPEENLGGGGVEVAQKNLSPWLRSLQAQKQRDSRPSSRYSETYSIETPFHNSRLSKGEDSSPTT